MSAFIVQEFSKRRKIYMQNETIRINIDDRDVRDLNRVLRDLDRTLNDLNGTLSSMKK